MKINKWIKQNTTNLTGKTIAITGSTGALASELIFNLAKLNANLILINRDIKKSELQKQQILHLNPNAQIELLTCDLSKFESVKICCEMLKQKQIDVLYFASAVYNVPLFQTDLNFNNVFQINFVSHYYLAKELLPCLKKNNGKIVAIGSVAYNYSSIDENDIDFSTRKKSSQIYGNSKRFLTFSLQELCKQHNVNLSIVHPGVTLTNITNHYPKAINWLVKLGIKIAFPTPKKASLSLIKGIFQNTLDNYWIGPTIFNVWGMPKINKLKIKNNEEKIKIFNIAEKIYENTKK